MKYRFRMRKGFTLIELLVVVLIMGILASVAMPQYFKSVEKSRATEAVEWLAVVTSAQDRHYMQKGSYASSLSELDVGLSNLNYFTIFGNPCYDGAASGNECRHALKRINSAGAGLGYYRIYVDLPAIPGTGRRTWRCSPKSAGCASFIATYL